VSDHLSNSTGTCTSIIWKSPAQTPGGDAQIAVTIACRLYYASPSLAAAGVCVRICMYVYTYMYMCIYIYVYTNLYFHIQHKHPEEMLKSLSRLPVGFVMHLPRLPLQLCIYVYVYIYIHICVCVFIYMYI